MKADIDSNQTVFVDDSGNVRFCHYPSSNFPHVLKLSSRQFLNFNDVLRALNHLSHFSWHPLGYGVWFYKKNNVAKLVNNQKQLFFQFYPRGWKKYKIQVHQRILSFLRNDKHASHHQSYARNESQSAHRSRRRFSTLSKRKHTSLRTTRNVGNDYDCDRTKSSTFSWRENTDFGPHSESGGGKYAEGDTFTFEEGSQDGDVSSVASVNYEYGCEPAVTISD